MPSFEHTNSQPKARKDDHFRPGDEAPENAQDSDNENASLGQDPLSWGDLAKEPEAPQEPVVPEKKPTPTEIASKEAILDEPEGSAEPEPESAPPSAVEKPKPQRIDDSHFPDPGPSLLQNRLASSGKTAAAGKRNRPETSPKSGPPEGHPGLVESPQVIEEKLSGRFAEGRPERKPRREPREPREEKPKAPELSEEAAKTADAPQSGEDAPNPKRKRRRNRKRKTSTADGGSASADATPRERGGDQRDQRGSKVSNRGPRNPGLATKKAVAKPKPEPKGLLGSVKKFFGSIFGGDESAAQPAPKQSSDTKSDDSRPRDRNRSNQNRGKGGGGQNRRGQGQDRSETGDQPKRRRGKRGGKNSRSGPRQGGQGGQGGQRPGDRGNQASTKET